MIFWSIFLIIAFVVCAYCIGRKIYNERKIKNGQRKLAGKVVLITGASSGIGEALAHKFYPLGCKVILAARRIGELERVRNNLLDTKINNGIQLIRPEILPLDIAELNQVNEKANQLLKSCHHVDILINNAGVSVTSNVQNVKQEVDTRVMNVNYFGAIALTKAFLPSMIEQKQGIIIFVSSFVGRFSIPYCSPYTASKHALQAFADCLRAEISIHNIKVMVSNPGYVATEISKNALTGYGTVCGDSFKNSQFSKAVASGQKPQECADDILRAVLRGDNEITPLKLLPMIWLRNLFPSIYFRAMEMRARKRAARHKITQIV